MITLATFLLMGPCAVPPDTPSRSRPGQEARNQARPDRPEKDGNRAQKRRQGLKDRARQNADKPRGRRLEGRMGPGKQRIRNRTKGQGICESCGRGGPATEPRQRRANANEARQRRTNPAEIRQRANAGEARVPKDMMGIRLRLGKAVQSGKLTREQAAEKMKAYMEKQRQSPNAEPRQRRAKKQDREQDRKKQIRKRGS